MERRKDEQANGVKKSRFLSKIEVVVNGCGLTKSDLMKIRNACDYGYSMDDVMKILNGEIGVRPAVYNKIASRLRDKANMVMPCIRVETLEDVIAKVAIEVEEMKSRRDVGFDPKKPYFS